MRAFAFMAAAAVAAFGMAATPAAAQLLGGTVGGIVDGLTGGGGDGSLGNTVGGTVDSVVGGVSTGGDVGVSGLATFNVASGGDGTNASGALLGGGGSTIDLPLGALLGGSSGATVELFDLGGLLGGPGQPGQPGAPGAPGRDGSNGAGGLNGAGGANGSNGINGLVGGSSRLAVLNRILQGRDWLRFAQGNKLCLPSFGVANVGSWVKPAEYGRLQQLIAAYGQDIALLQQMLKRCRNGQARAMDIDRVIGIDQRADGQLVVMTI